MGRKERFDPKIWGTKADYRRAAESVGLAAKGLAKDLVRADSSREERRLDELIAEAERGR